MTVYALCKKSYTESVSIFISFVPLAFYYDIGRKPICWTSRRCNRYGISRNEGTVDAGQPRAALVAIRYIITNVS